MKKIVYTWVKNWKNFKWKIVSDIRKCVFDISCDERLPKTFRAIYAKFHMSIIRCEKKLAKEYLLFNPGLSKDFQKKMEKIVRDSGL